MDGRGVWCRRDDGRTISRVWPTINSTPISTAGALFVFAAPRIVPSSPFFVVILSNGVDAYEPH